MERLLQSASDLSTRRLSEARRAQGNNLGFSARLGLSVWKGITNQLPSPVISPDTSEDEASTEEEPEPEVVEQPPEDLGTGISSRLASTVWRGITNQSAMEPPPTPMSAYPTTPPRSPSPSEPPSSPGDPSQRPSLWNYAERLRQSDTAANLSRASSNWRARGLLSPWGSGASSVGNASPPSDPIDHPRRGSLPPEASRKHSSPSPPPSNFRSPRSSIIFSPVETSPRETPSSPHSDSGVLSKARNLQASLSALTHAKPSAPPAKPKAGPKPLFLGSGASTLATAAPNRHRQSQSSIGQWADVVNHTDGHRQRDSISSMSSLSPSEGLLPQPVIRAQRDSDPAKSRVVSLNRRSVSPMAYGARTPDFRAPSFRESMSSVSSSDRGLSSPSRAPARGWGRVDDASDAASPPPRTPVTLSNGHVRVTNGDDGTDHLMSPQESDAEYSPKLSRKAPKSSDDDQKTLSGSLSRASRRTKSRPSRPSELHIADGSMSKVIAEQSPNSLQAGWGDHDPEVRTPKATDFEEEDSAGLRGDKKSTRSRKLSTETSPRLRKSPSGSEARSRKISSGSRRKAPVIADSDAEKGDDELDDLLSAYDSETSSVPGQ